MSATKYLSVNSSKSRILEQFPSAGPNPSIKGMKELYWGKDAYCVKSGKYVYKVSKEVYESI